MGALKTGVAATVSLFAIWAPANAEHQQVSDAEYTTQALSAAPEGVAKGAAVVRVEHDGTLRTLREGNNGFTCMIMATDKMCNDQNSMEFIDAVMHRTLAPHAIAEAQGMKQVDGTLLEHAGANGGLDIGAAAIVEHDRLDAPPVQKVRKQKARRPCADDANLGTHRLSP